jgi:hypothetical protein
MFVRFKALEGSTQSLQHVNSVSTTTCVGHGSTENAVFWDVTPCGYCENRCFRGTYHLHHQGGKNQRTRLIDSSIRVEGISEVG